MTRQTIDYGIDLGTTNSLIAVLRDAGPEIIRNDDNMEFTPSAVTIRKSGAIYVGSRAKQRVEDDPDNAHAEFKREMGVTDSAKRFVASGRSMTPPELSAEVLKALRANAERIEPVGAAVITIPAAFALNQSRATRQAAELAGFTTSPLLQEPTAAAYAYSFRKEVDRAFWLVYDFGGGTFDAAVISIRDGRFTVANHAGDNHLGGTRIDWDIVDQILIPAVQREYRLPNFCRGEGMDPRWRGNIATLKGAAEQAKIQLSSRTTVDIDVELLDGQKKLNLEFQLTRKELEGISAKYYEQSIRLCRRALADARLGAGDIEKVLLVGGTTIAPAVRELLMDPAEGLGIAIDQSLDPVTVVAKGAAVYAGTQLLPRPLSLPAPAAGEHRLELTYTPQGEDLEPLVGGRVESGGKRDWTGFTIQFADPTRQPPWTGPKVPLSAQGAFTTRLQAQPMASSTFHIELRDSTGTLVPVSPTTLVYRHSGIDSGRTVLPESVGVALVGEEMLWFARKGTELRHSQTETLRTTVDVNRAAGTGVINIPVLQGERRRADRNRQVGMLTVTAAEVHRSVPAGSEVQVTIEIDESQRVLAAALVPLLDKEWDIKIDLLADRPGAKDLQSELAEARSRLASARERAATAVAPEARRLLADLDKQDLLGEATKLAATAGAYPADALACESRLQELHAMLDDIEDALDLPEQLSHLDSLREEVGRHLDPTSRVEVEAWDREYQSARKAGDSVGLQRLGRDLFTIHVGQLRRSGNWEPFRFSWLSSLEDEMTSRPQARRLIAEGQFALNRGQHQRLSAINEQLARLLPSDRRDEMPASTVDRW